MKLILLVTVLCSTPLWSQSILETDLLKEKTDLIKNLTTYNEYVNSNLEKLTKEKAKQEELKKKLQDLETYEKNFSVARAYSLAGLYDKIDSLSFTKKIGRTGKFYKCLRDSLEEKNFLNHSECLKRHPPKLSSEEKAEIDSWNAKTGIPLEEATRKKKNLPGEITKSQEKLVSLEKNLENSKNQVTFLNKSLKTTQLKLDEMKLIPKNMKFINCDASTPAINLEEEVPFENAGFEGPFHGVPRDNQDGLGTCYANTAKNLLVGVSKGKAVASFLDLALHYKSSNGSLSQDGLDAGSSCATLNAVQENGYCPQGFSPLETGERNHAGEGLFNLGPYNYLATNINMVRGFLQGLSSLEKSENPLTAEILAKSSEIISAIKSNPNLILPLPIVRHNVPEEWKLKEAHAWKKLERQIPYDKFLEEHREAYKKFYPNYIKAVIEGKSADAIFELYKIDMAGFISKYKLQNNLEEFKRVYKLRVKNDINDPELKAKLTDTIKFLKDIMNKTQMSDENFYEFCATSGAESMRLLGSMQPLIAKIREDKINEEKLFDDKGKLRPAHELMQLTIAPSCLNQENRKSVPAFTCDNGYGVINKIRRSGKNKTEQVKMLRERVVLSLVQGYPLGNSFPTSSGAGHINTIVGMRFNQATNSCEYLIRESQNGKSEWERESTIFDKIQGLTEIRRQK